ncbi:M23 family metallopeptidase [Geodermatophilus sabuli]|uniref:Peptidase family M23 n=1 Tax=Geodermatophilus sabuli TaxID=1564158 RepID=A0A285E8A7_9ACTN|nr:M23 family metallopeptidase [Geodermatophilus sabuli]MBB3082798.1 murein DD-endopeptidase MepM/ murein hydrolase activator NlpD [Geodermatophilus sabuli]SNX94336.1 Peptidase family M23 [Geodermatophilus sabuli]
MTQLHDDRLLAEGSAPVPGEQTLLDRAAVPSPRQQQTPAGEPATHTIPTPRSGDAQPSDTDQRALGEVTDLAGLSGLAEATARAGIDALTDRSAADPVPERAETAVPVVTGGQRGRHRRPLPPVLSRRRAFYLAAALVGAAGLGLFSAGGPAAQTDPAEAAASVSVAEELGLTQQSGAAVEVDAATRLEEMTASRTAREAEQAAAAQVQADADRLAAEAAAEAARPKAVLPVDGARLSSTFGARWGTQHAGIDFAAPMRTPEYAAMDGIVLEAGPASGYGNAVYIQHENGDVTVYGHMEEILVSPGQVVRAGDTIALLGNRGRSTGPHLHFEVRIGGPDGQKIDPLPWLRERGVQI